MKKRFLATSILALALGFGVAAGLSLASNESSTTVKEVEAIGSGNIYVRCTRPTGWGDTLKCHYWGGISSSTWPGANAVTTYNNNLGQTVFVFEIPSNSTGLIFNNGNWKTDDLSLNNTGNSWYLGTNIYQDSSDYGTWTPSTYTVKVYDSANYLGGEVYLYSFRGSNCNSGHIKMGHANLDYLSDYFYTLQVDELYSNMIVTTGSWSAQTSDLTPDSDKYFVITNKNGSTISGSYYDNTDYVYAMDWVNHEMHMQDIPTSNTSDTGACRGANGYYQKAKSAYQTYSGIKDQVQYVQGYQDAFARFSDWATANGETASFSGTTLVINSKINLLPTEVGGGVETASVVVVASILSLAAVGGYFVLRKKKLK